MDVLWLSRTLLPGARGRQWRAELDVDHGRPLQPHAPAGDIVYWLVGCVGGGEPSWRRHCSLWIRKLPGEPGRGAAFIGSMAAFVLKLLSPPQQWLPLGSDHPFSWAGSRQTFATSVVFLPSVQYARTTFCNG